jgi:hypothetical protein
MTNKERVADSLAALLNQVRAQSSNFWQQDEAAQWLVKFHGTLPALDAEGQDEQTVLETLGDLHQQLAQCGPLMMNPPRPAGGPPQDRQATPVNMPAELDRDVRRADEILRKLQQDRDKK